MGGLSTFIHAGKEILHFDYRGHNEEETIALIDQANDILLECEKQGSVLPISSNRIAIEMSVVGNSSSCIPTE